MRAPMPPDTPAADPLAEVTRTLEPAYRLDTLVALSRERALYQAWDRLLKRPVAVIVCRKYVWIVSVSSRISFLSPST